MVPSLLLSFRQVCHYLIINVLFPKELIFELLFTQVSQLQFAHELIHGITVQKLAIADLADLTASLQLGIVIFICYRHGHGVSIDVAIRRSAEFCRIATVDLCH